MVARSDVGVVVTPGHSILSPQTVKRTRCVSCFCNLMLHTAQKYVAFQPCGMLWNSMKNYVFVPLCSFHPSDSLPSSLHILLFQISLLFRRMRCPYSRILTVFSLFIGTNIPYVPFLLTTSNRTRLTHIGTRTMIARPSVHTRL